MTIETKLRASQPAAGAPIVLAVQFSDRPSDEVNSAWIGIGVTATSSPPATLAGFIRTDGFGVALFTEASDPLFDTKSETAVWGQAGGVNTVQTNAVNATLLKRLDANYAAGRFLWFGMFDTAIAPISTDAPSSLSTPFAIT
jgi:hypothetical protein